MSTEFKNIIFLITYTWKTEKKYILFRIPHILTKSIEPFVMVIFPKLIIDQLLLTNDINNVFPIILIMIVTSFLIKIILRILDSCMDNSLNCFNQKHLLNIGQRVMHLDFKDIEDSKILDLFERTKGAEYCEKLYSSLSNIITNSITCLGLLLIISQLNFLILMLIFLIVSLNVVCNKKVQEYIYQWHVDAAPLKRINDYVVRLMHSFQYGKEIRIYNLSNYLINKYNKISKQYLTGMYKITNHFLKLNIITSVSSIIQEGILYFYLSYKVITSSLSIGSFMMYLNSIKSFTDCLIKISSNIVSLSKFSKYIEDFKSLNLLKAPADTTGKILGDISHFIIEFKDVSFKYPGSNNYILTHINVKIESGKKISIVGTNGAGKTTFIKLILRLYEPTSGSITLNGVNILDIDYDFYISLLSSVFQDSRIFSYSIKENISLTEKPDELLVQDSVIKSGLDKKIKTLPKQLDTVMFRFLDDEGIELSGGEGQKLCIARALYKNTPIIILDEPLSALDPLAEYEIYRNINNSVQGKCVLFISHRLSITKFCDQVLVFHKGQIVQQGVHNDLIKEKDKLYFEMYSKQTELYESN